MASAVLLLLVCLSAFEACTAEPVKLKALKKPKYLKAASAAEVQAQMVTEATLAEAMVLEQTSQQPNQGDAIKTPPGSGYHLLRTAPRETFNGGQPVGAFARPDTTDSQVFNQLFDPGWEYDTIMGKIDQLHPGFAARTIVDAGGNCGLGSLFFSHKYPDSLIVAVEPDPDNIKIFKSQHMHNNAWNPQVRLVEGGVWKSNSKLKIQDPNAEKWAIQLDEVPEDTPDAMTGFTILGAMKNAGLHKMKEWTGVIDVVKMDIEGSEKHIFSDPGFKEWLDRTNVLIIELHGWFVPGSDTAYKKAIEKISDDFHQFVHGENDVLVRKNLILGESFPSLDDSKDDDKNDNDKNDESQ